MSDETVELTRKCPTCANVMAISPEDLVLTCDYCGETIDVDGKKIPEHKMLPSMDYATIKGNIEQFLKKNRVNEGSLSELKAVYLPYWVVPFNSSTQYYGVLMSQVTRQKTETYRDSEGKTRTRTVSYTVNVYRDEQGNFQRSGRENVIGRKHTAFYGFDNFQNTLQLENIQDFDFQRIKQHDAEFINAEVDHSEAQRDAFGRVENQNRSIAAGKVYKLIRCDSTVNVMHPTYVHAPLWQARYKFQGKVYKVSASGDNGKVMKGEVPITLGQRVAFLIVGVALLLAFAFLGQYGFDTFIGGEDMGIVLVIIGAVLMIVGLVVASNGFKMQKEKSERVKRAKPAKKAKSQG